MTICSPTQVRNRSRVRDGRRRFDSLTIGLHWATVALITGMFASAWVLLASGREHAAILLNVHRSLGVVTWAVAIVRLGWRFSFAYLPPFPGTMPRVQQRFAKASEYGLYALLLSQPLTGLAQSLARGRSFMLFEWHVPKVMAGNKALTLLFHQIHTVSAWLRAAWERAAASSGAKVELGASTAAGVCLQGSIDWSTSSLRTRW